MAVRLRAASESELADYLTRARETYERQMIEFGGIDPARARAKAETDTANLFPGGRPAKGVHAFCVVDENSETSVGLVFFASLPRAGHNVAFIYGLEIDERFRGKGLGRATMVAVENEARELGHAEIRLNVFGGNDRARALYHSLGYIDVDVTMMKKLA